MAKKLLIKCALCDARNAQKAALEAYESVHIQCASLIVTPESKALLNTLGVTWECADMVETDGNVKFSSINGKAQIRKTDHLEEKVFLQLNGILEIEPGAGEVLRQYAGISINGKLICPESLSGSLGMLKINGKTLFYPDDAVVLKKDAAIDRLFVLRAKNRLYWCPGRMLMTDPKLDTAALIRKGATFRADEIIIAESLVEAMIDSIDEKAQLTVVPDGTNVITDDLELNATAVKRYGRKLYIAGDMSVAEEGEEALASLEYLCVRGDVRVPEGLRDMLLEKAAEISGKLKVQKGRRIRKKLFLRISREMLEEENKGITASECMEVFLDGDIPSDLIQERLGLEDCMQVHCAPEQKNAVTMVSEDVAQIDTGEKEKKRAFDPDTKVIAAAQYIL